MPGQQATGTGRTVLAAEADLTVLFKFGNLYQVIGGPAAQQENRPQSLLTQDLAQIQQGSQSDTSPRQQDLIRRREAGQRKRMPQGHDQVDHRLHRPGCHGACSGSGLTHQQPEFLLLFIDKMDGYRTTEICSWRLIHTNLDKLSRGCSRQWQHIRTQLQKHCIWPLPLTDQPQINDLFHHTYF